jgi:hypothetical protein
MNIEKELEEAEADLAKAHHELADAEHDVEAAARKIEKVIEEEKHHQPFKIEVVYDGVTKSFEVRHEETVKTLLDQAVEKFGPIPNAHTLGLYNKAGAELDINQTLDAAGVKPGDKLLMRPSQVRGG